MNDEKGKGSPLGFPGNPVDGAPIGLSFTEVEAFALSEPVNANYIFSFYLALPTADYERGQRKWMHCHVECFRLGTWEWLVSVGRPGRMYYVDANWELDAGYLAYERAAVSVAYSRIGDVEELLRPSVEKTTRTNMPLVGDRDWSPEGYRVGDIVGTKLGLAQITKLELMNGVWEIGFNNQAPCFVGRDELVPAPHPRVRSPDEGDE